MGPCKEKGPTVGVPWGGQVLGDSTRGHGGGYDTWYGYSSHVHVSVLAQGGGSKSPELCPLVLVGMSLMGLDVLPPVPKTDPPSPLRAANPSATAGCST